MKKQKLQMVAWAFMMACIMIGGFLGLYIFGKEPGEYAIAITGV